MLEKLYIVLVAVICFSFSACEVIEEYMENQEYLYSTPLCDIMTSYGSDKGSGTHNYTTLYSKLLDQWKNTDIKIFELGLGTNFLDVPSNMGINGKPGASHFGWATYFPKAHVYGADIDRRILFQTERIKTYYCDQRSETSIKKMFSDNNLKDLNFDVIVDDGLHIFKANYTFLLGSIAKLKKGGIYIIEDLNNDTRSSFQAILPKLKRKFALTYIKIIDVPHKTNGNDNRLLIIQK